MGIHPQRIDLEADLAVDRQLLVSQAGDGESAFTALFGKPLASD